MKASQTDAPGTKTLTQLAHTIRNYSSKQFKALTNIQSHIRWCLTGTPIQNSLQDLESLIRFLRMPPFNEPAVFRKHVPMAKLRKGTNIPDFENLRLILSSICLRRPRSMLPNKGHAEETREIMFTETERNQYRLLASACKAAVKMGGKKRGNDQAHRGVM